MKAMTPPTRDALLRTLDQTSEWDMVVIGGGATGLGVAVDSAARGYRTLLVEACDFAKGTSSRSTKLVHGGVRYLAQGNIALVREALRERGRLARNAPHIVHSLGFLVPAFRRRDRLLYGAGLKCYDLLAGESGFIKSRSLDANEARAAVPSLAATLDGNPLRGGTLYFDGQFDDARLAISLMRTIFNLGGVALNRVAVKGISREASGRQNILLEDTETGAPLSVRARCVVNATGVWVDAIRAMVEPVARPLVAPSQGVHLTVPGRFLASQHAIMVPKTDDGRVLFVVPWHGHAIVGTTDRARSDMPGEPRASEAEIDFILRNAARYLSAPPTRADVLSVWVGLRPLVRGEKGANSAALSREHIIETHPSGLISVTGGKWTTYRRMAEEVVDQAIAAGFLTGAPCRTEELALHGAQPTPEATAHEPINDSYYGTDRAELAQLAGADRTLIAASGLTEAQVRFAARAELARSVEDVLARRNRALFLDARAAMESAPDVARILAEELGHDATWQQREVAAFTDLARAWRLT
jgi:glycerol-3-phosphate dehydrogenase